MPIGSGVSGRHFDAQRVMELFAGADDLPVAVRISERTQGWYESEVQALVDRLAQEEIFGPVLAVMKATTMTEALMMANATRYALTGGIYSRSPANLAIAREQFDVGNLYVNRPITGALVSRQPFGGHRCSGVGAKAGGEDYLAQFMITRITSENTLRRGFESAQ